MNRIVKLMRCVVFAAALYAGSLSAQQVTPAMIQRAKAMGATQEQIDAALAERNERREGAPPRRSFPFRVIQTKAGTRPARARARPRCPPRRRWRKPA